MSGSDDQIPRLLEIIRLLANQQAALSHAFVDLVNTLRRSGKITQEEFMSLLDRVDKGLPSE